MLAKFDPYKHLNKLIQNETYEPVIAWGFRMAMAAMAPLIWGVATGQIEAASWMIIAAECICWAELKGSFAQRIRLLSGAFAVAFLFAILGSITGSYIWLSVLAMIFAGFVAGLFKNLGDRGSGLSVCVQVMFVIANAYPTHTFPELQERLGLVLTGGAWTIFTGIAVSLFTPAQRPYRRMIAIVWRANARLTETVFKGWDGKAIRSSMRDIYEKEKDVRTALDGSFHFFETMLHQANKDETEKYQLAQLRKSTALVASHIIAVSEELELIRIKDMQQQLRIKIYDALQALQQSLERVGVFVVSLKPEEELLIHAGIARLNKLIVLLKEHKGIDDSVKEESLKRIILLLERSVRLMQASLKTLADMGEDLPVIQSYSLIKTLFVLHPKYWLRNLRLLLNFNTGTVRYALRSALAAALGLFIYKWFEIDHGYWLPFTSLIVVQPFFTATFKKAIDRVLGTLAGGVAGGLLIRLPAAIYIKELMLFICFVMMVYFIRKRYSVAVFFVTLSVVLLFDVEETIDATLILTRALCTIGGAIIGITAGFSLLPAWDREHLPQYVSDAIGCNYQYFTATFFSEKETVWTRHKRSAESKNSNAFDSFSRYMREPSLNKKKVMTYYQLINHSVRITRELNNIHIEQENREEEQINIPEEAQQQVILECLRWFNRNMDELKKLHKGVEKNIIEEPQKFIPLFPLTTLQKIYLDKLLIELKTLHQDLSHIGEKI